MLVLVSFVLVLAAAVTLVVGLLQSGLTLIYLSIGASVLAGIVLAVAVLRGRPEPKASAPVGRPFTPPVSAPPVPASVGAPTGTSTGTSPADAAATTSFSPPPPAPPPPVPVRATAGADDAAATKAAGNALLGRLRGRRVEEDAVVDAAPEPVGARVAEYGNEPVTATMPVIGVEDDEDDEDDEGFPIADYDQLRATDLLRRLTPLDRNQLEAVRDRETAGKNRFTILSRVDTLLEAQSEPAWEVADDEWDDDEAGAETTVIEVGAVDDEDEFDDDDEDEDEELAAGEMEDDEADEVDEFDQLPDEMFDDEDEEVDELVSPADDFPIAGYDSLTVGQILPRLSDLEADELAEVRAREQQGRARGTILDRIDRLASKSAPMAMPAAAPARKAPVRRKAAAIPAPPATSPMKEAVRKAAARKKATPPPTPIPTPTPTPRKASTRKAAAIPVPPATSTTPMKEAVKKAAGRKKAAPPPAPAPAPRKAATRKAATRKAAAPVIPDASPMKAAVKKARAAKATKRP